MNEKIRPEHLQRAAYLYIRQSTAHQVRFHLEGQKRQYELSQRARELGFTQVVVIDEDLGRSGSGLQERPGFGRLLAAVCQGAVGAVVALEASRLARNNRDWHHLVNRCGLTDTLLIDDDGIYDPKLLNDRLLLGLKGTMSEFELGLFRQRARQAFVQKATKIKDRLLSDSPHLPPERSVGEVSPIPSSSLSRTDGAVITSGGVNARATPEAP
jgi:DNA invertase Pin-like site-specific DNA recombinase